MALTPNADVAGAPNAGAGLLVEPNGAGAGVEAVPNADGVPNVAAPAAVGLEPKAVGVVLAPKAAGLAPKPDCPNADPAVGVDVDPIDDCPNAEVGGGVPKVGFGEELELAPNAAGWLGAPNAGVDVPPNAVECVEPNADVPPGLCPNPDVPHAFPPEAVPNALGAVGVANAEVLAPPPKAGFAAVPKLDCPNAPPVLACAPKADLPNAELVVVAGAVVPVVAKTAASENDSGRELPTTVPGG